MKTQIALAFTILGLTFFCQDANSQDRRNIFSMSEGTVVVSCSSDDHSSMWSPLNAFDGDPQRGWGSAKGKITNQDITIELPQKYKMRQIIIDNENAQDGSFCAKTVEIWGSVFDEATGFKKIASVTAAKLARTKIDLPDTPILRRIKFVVVDNWGDLNQAQIMEIEGFAEPVGKAETAPNFVNGTYSSDLGVIKLKQNGNQVLGCIEKDSGTIYGALRGNVMRFEYRKDGTTSSAARTTGAGIMIFNGSGMEANGSTSKDGNIQSLWLTKKNNMIACYCKMPEDNSINQRLKENRRAILFGITFEGSTASLRSEADTALNDLLNALKDNTQKIQIEGYSDANGTTAANIRLSTNRAQAVCDWLISRKIDATRLSIKGFGESRPIGDNSTPQGRYLNNRIEISTK